MNATTIDYIDIITQDARMVTLNEKRNFPLMKLIHNIILEYGVYKHGTIYIDADNLSIGDKRLLLSYYESPEFYEELHQSEMLTQAAFNESKKHFQKLLDENCHEVYIETMEEMRAYK